MLTFRPITRADFELISSWLSETDVARWWNDDPALAAIEKQYGPSIDGTDPTEVFVVHEDGQPVGLIQRYRIDDEPEYGPELAAVCEVPAGSLSLDYFVGDPAHRGRGLGVEMVAELVADSWRWRPDAPAVIIPVALGNERSWRTLERAGFRRVAVGPMTPDNPIDPPDHVIYRIDRPAV